MAESRRLRARFDPTRLGSPSAVAVIGLGRFGRALAVELVAGGVDVLGVDADEDIVQALDGVLTHVVRADATKPEVLEQLGIAEYGRVVIAIGSDIQSSILVASQLVRLDVTRLWAKAVSEQHALILSQLGVAHVVRPEADMGKRVAHMVLGALDDYVELAAGLVAAQLSAPRALLAVPLRELGLTQQHGVGIAAVCRSGTWLLANQETRLEDGDRMLVLGVEGKVEAFARAYEA